MSLDTSRVREDVAVPVTKMRNFRCDEELWDEAQRLADDNRESMSAILRRALVEYIKANGGKVPHRSER